MLRFDLEIPKNLEHLFSDNDNPQSVVLDALRFKAQYGDSLQDIKSMCLELLAREPESVQLPAAKPAPVILPTPPVIENVAYASDVPSNEDDDDDFLSMILK